MECCLLMLSAINAMKFLRLFNETIDYGCFNQTVKYQSHELCPF